MTLTLLQVESWLPCPEYPAERLRGLWAGRESLDLGDLLDLGLPPDDLLWVLLREAWLSPAKLDGLAERYLMHCALIIGPERQVGDKTLESYLMAYKSRQGSFEGLPVNEQTSRWMDGATEPERRAGLCALWCAVTEARASGEDHDTRAAAWDAVRHWQVSRAILATEGD